MKTIVNNIIIAIVLIAAIFCCTKEPDPSGGMNLTATLFGNPQCKGLKSAELVGSRSNSQSCIEYSFNQTLKILTLKHINAGFNCCPESLSCTATNRNDTIVIQEFEKSMGCKCNCLYDLEMEVNGVEPGKYQLRIIEPYVGSQVQLNFELDLLKQKEGTWCVTRWVYPWGE